MMSRVADASREERELHGRRRDFELTAEAWARMLRRAGREEDADAVVARYSGAGAGDAAGR